MFLHNIKLSIDGRVIGELAMHLLGTTFSEVKDKPCTEEVIMSLPWPSSAGVTCPHFIHTSVGHTQESRLSSMILPPMIPGNWEAESLKCIIGNKFLETVSSEVPHSVDLLQGSGKHPNILHPFVNQGERKPGLQMGGRGQSSPQQMGLCCH